MARNKFFPIAILLLLLGLFVATGDYVLRESFSRGEGYVAYSSYRSDPLGARVFYDALAAMPGMNVSRNQTNFQYMDTDGRGKALFILDATHSYDPKNAMEQVETFVESGGRLVISFTHMPKEVLATLDPDREDDDKKKRRKSPNEERREQRDALLEKMNPMINIEEEWGFDFRTQQSADRSDEDPIKTPTVTRAEGFPGLAEELAWYSEGYFADLDDAWTAIYERKAGAVLMERNLGEGTIVLSSASYPFSNEALRYKRDSALLNWFVGDANQVIFDEYTHGVNMDPTIIDLIIRLRLHWFLFSLVPLALLHAWRSAVPLVPHHSQDWQAEAQALQRGRDAADGLKHLIEGAVGTKELAEQGHAIWAQTFQRDSRYSTEQRQQALALATSEEGKKQPVETFNTIAKTIHSSTVKENNRE